MANLSDLINRIKRVNDERDWNKFHTPSNLAKSICIEASELLECFQWNETNYDKEDVKEELADVINYCLQLAIEIDVDIVDIVNQKMDKTEEKYPVEKCKGKSTKYNKL